MQRWIERSEARWALWAGIAGALATAALSTRMILSQGSSSAGLGFIFLPLVAAASLPLAVGTEIWNGKSLERAFDESAFRRDKYFLGALAGLEDPVLFEPMWSLWDVMGENRDGIAVMRLVARHPNVSRGTLARLEALQLGSQSVNRRAPR